MKLATYNMQFGGRGRVQWNEILEQVHPDILLAQESSLPEQHLTPLFHGTLHQKATWNSVPNQSWGSAVFVGAAQTSQINLPEFNGWVVGVEISQFTSPTGSKRPLRIFSVHAPTGLGSYQKNVNAILDMLLEQRVGCDVVIGGDFNLTVGQRHASEDRTTDSADLAIQARLRNDFRLINCWQAANPDKPLAQTLRWGSNRAIAFHVDGLFVPQDWQPHLLSCDVLTGVVWDELSDHNPVIAEFASAGVRE